MADPEKKPPLKPPSRPRSLPAFVYGVPEDPAPVMGPVPQQPEVYAPLGWLRPYLAPLGDFVEGFIGTQADPLAPPGSPVPSRAALAGAVVGAVNPLTPLKALGRGLYSRVDDALRLLPVKGAHANKVLSILKSNASAEELAFRKVPEWLAAQGNTAVTPEALAAHLQAHPSPLPNVVTRGARPAELLKQQQAAGDRVATMRAAAFDDPTDWVGVSDLDRTNAHWWALEAAGGDARALRKLKEIAVDPDHLETLLAFGRARNESTAVARQIEAVPTTKYGNYTVPGGENYRETLLTLPPEMKKQGRYKVEIRSPTGEVIYHDPNVGATDVERMRQTHEGKWGGRTVVAEEIATPSGEFRSGHFEEPNIVVHTRANERTLPTGERGRFVEEVQSDWHQQGKKQGYAPTDPAAVEADLRARDLALTDELRALGEGDTAQHRVLREQQGALIDEWNAFHDTQRSGIPDAPFKESWPDLGLKQQLLDTAADPEASWLGFTSGQTQAARYDLSKQIDELKWYRDGDGYRISAKKDGQIVAQKTGMSPQELSATVGKEMAEKITANAEQHGAMAGLDLQVGGEGMQYFYDQLLRKRLEKIVKPFGGTVERGAIGTRTKAQIDAEMDAIMAADPHGERLTAQYNALQAERNVAPDDTAAWLARLSPEMKARILKEGLPLMTLFGGASLASLGQPRPREERR